MATANFLGDKIMLELDTSTTDVPDWKLVACVTTSDLDGTRQTIDVASKCGPGTLPGNPTDTANFAGFMSTNIDPATQVSLNDIRSVYKNNTIAHWRFLDIDTTGAEFYREFYGGLTTWNESFNTNEAVTFTAAIAINGGTIDTAPTT